MCWQILRCSVNLHVGNHLLKNIFLVCLIYNITTRYILKKPQDPTGMNKSWQIKETGIHK